MWYCRSDVYSPIYYSVVTDDNLSQLSTLCNSKDILARCYSLLLAHEPYQLRRVDLLNSRLETVYQHPDLSRWTAGEKAQLVGDVQNQLMKHMESHNREEEIIWSYVLAMMVLRDLIDHPSASRDDGDDLFSPKLAIAYLKYAAQNKFPLAVYDYAMLCIEGKRFYQAIDLPKGKEMLEVCLQLDPKHRLAQFQLAELYFHGDGGIQRDWKLAIQYYYQAAEQLLPAACYQLGMLAFNGYEDGPKSTKNTLVKQPVKTPRISSNLIIAMEYLCRASELGHKEALYQVGMYYFQPSTENAYHRKEVIRLPGMQSIANLEAFGIQLIKFSAELGYGQAEYTLSECYFDGKGVEQNLQMSMAALQRH